MGAQEIPFQEACEVAGLHAGVIDHVGLRMGALHDQKRGGKDAHAVGLRLPVA